MKAIMTGGIGDFIAIESHIPRRLKKEIEVISLGCFHNSEIKEILEACGGSYPNLKKVDFFFSDFVNDPHTGLPVPGGNLEEEIGKLEKRGFLNLSMTSSFEKIMKKEMLFSGSCIFDNKLADVDRFNLPRGYCVIFPYSLKAMPQRQYDERDWRETLRMLSCEGKKGVVITQSVAEIPKSDDLIVLRNATSISDAVEIIKKSQGFIGIDTFAATIAAQMPIRMAVKSTNEKTHTWKKHIYFAPRKNFSFLGRKINNPRPMI